MIEVGEGVSLPASEFVGNVLQGAYYYNLSPERYMKDMELAGKVIKMEPLDSKTDFDKDIYEQDTQRNQGKEKEIDWEDRHFQICLALISRADLTSLHANHVSTKEIVPDKIIKQADKMVEALKKHYEEKSQK